MTPVICRRSFLRPKRYRYYTTTSHQDCILVCRTDEVRQRHPVTFSILVGSKNTNYNRAKLSNILCFVLPTRLVTASCQLLLLDMMTDALPVVTVQFRSVFVVVHGWNEDVAFRFDSTRSQSFLLPVISHSALKKHIFSIQVLNSFQP
jgi:hypothetical protein